MCYYSNRSRIRLINSCFLLLLPLFRFPYLPAEAARATGYATTGFAAVSLFHIKYEDKHAVALVDGLNGEVGACSQAWDEERRAGNRLCPTSIWVATGRNCAL